MKIIEFLGMPRAGKTTQVSQLESNLKDAGYRVGLIDDRVRASRISVPASESLAYLISFATAALDEFYIYTDVDFLIIDRGFNDTQVWADFYHGQSRITLAEKKAIQNLFQRYAQQVHVTFDFQISVAGALSRHREIGHTLHADELLMNEPMLTALQRSYIENHSHIHNRVVINGTEPSGLTAAKILDLATQN